MHFQNPIVFVVALLLGSCGIFVFPQKYLEIELENPMTTVSYLKWIVLLQGVLNAFVFGILMPMTSTLPRISMASSISRVV
jgi:hypothetical protein